MKEKALFRKGHPILRKLRGGDRRSIGRLEEVESDVLHNPTLFKILLNGFVDPDPIVRMRSADAVEKISLIKPKYLWPHKKFLIEQATMSIQKEVRWHLAQVLPRLKLNQEEKAQVVDLLLSYTRDGSSIVKTFAMQALADIGMQNPNLRTSILTHLRKLTESGTPAMKARGRKLLEMLEKTMRNSIRIRR